MGFLDRVAGSVGGSLGEYSKPPDLRPFAAERGLTYVGTGDVAGIWGVSGHGGDEANVMHGALPGGEPGALCHVKQLTGTSTNSETGNTTSNYAAHTRIAARVPEAVGLLQRFRLTNNIASGYLRETDAFLEKVKMKDFGFQGGMGWGMAAAPGADRAFLGRLLGGDFGARLDAVPCGFALRYEYGSLLLVCAEGYEGGQKLDVLCQHFSGLAQVLRNEARSAAATRDFEQALPEPSWIGQSAPAPKSKSFLGMTVQLGSWADSTSDEIGGLGEPLMDPWRSAVTQFAQQAGMTLEDPLAYHRAFPTVPVPGRAYAVMRGTLETGATGRIAFSTEGGGGGPVAVVCRVKEGTPNRPMPIGGDTSAMNVAVNDGFMAAWLLRGAQVQGAEIQAMSEQAWALAEREGWVPA